jgi:cyclopropane fatty-acyl-phospholipid synthase-like methyltransferase
VNPIFLIVAAIALFASLTIRIELSNAQSPHTHQHSFGDAQQWSKYFDDPKRDEWQKPHEIIQALGLAPDSVVADIGSGTGYFSVRLAHFVPKGHVYGVDTEPDMVKYLADRIKRDALSNVTSLTGEPDDPQLPTKVDLVLMVDVFHHISNRDQYFKKLKDYLKPGGRLALIDFTESSPMGPPPAERVSPARVKSELMQAGYKLAVEHTFLPNQFFLVFKTAIR